MCTRVNAGSQAARLLDAAALASHKVASPRRSASRASAEGVAQGRAQRREAAKLETDLVPRTVGRSATGAWLRRGDANGLTIWVGQLHAQPCILCRADGRLRIAEVVGDINTIFLAVWVSTIDRGRIVTGCLICMRQKRKHADTSGRRIRADQRKQQCGCGSMAGVTALRRERDFGALWDWTCLHAYLPEEAVCTSESCHSGTHLV